MEQQLPGREVTCILTSCGRFDLLERTLDSFFKFNTYDITEFYIYEDSGLPVPASLKEQYPFIKWFEPSERTGQIAALDTLWQAVKTPYAFTMEDDWETYRTGFIEESMKILEVEPKIMQVWLREKEDTNGHPVYWQTDKPYGIMKTNHGLWTGLCWNPSLKRKADYETLGSYGRHTQFLRKRPWQAESDIGKIYQRMGFKAAILPQGYIKHIGNDRHVS